MHTIAETEQFKKRAKALKLSDEDLMAIYIKLATDPKCGTSLGGGLYKLRVARQGGGKSGGYRVVYFYRLEDIPVQLLTIFAKNDKDNISQAEKKALIDIGDILIQLYRRSK